MSGSLFGNVYVFVAWAGKDTVSQSEQTTLAILLGAVSFSGVLLLLLTSDFKIRFKHKENSVHPKVYKSNLS